MISKKLKDKISRNFTLAASTYNKVALEQKNCAQVLVHKLVKSFPLLSPNKILDIGSGTGFVAEELLRYYPNAQYYLNDISNGMLIKAQKKLKEKQNFSFICGDAEYLDFDHYDLMISNFSFQWFDNLKTAMTRYSKKTKTLAFTTLLEGSLAKWTRLYKSLNLMPPTFPYPKEKEIIKTMNEIQAKSSVFFKKSYIKRFDSQLSCAKYFKQLGANTHFTHSQYSHLKTLIEKRELIEIEYKVFFAILNFH